VVGPKLKFVLSDLHLGAGHIDQNGNPLEDFTADEGLANLLHDIWLESQRDQREVELIINGDFFEFLQVPAVDVYNPDTNYPSEAYLDSSQEASIKRLNIITQDHPEVFNALSDFIHVERPQRRITIIKGNHDVNLYWPGVKSRLREILGASGTRASLLLFADEFVSREKIYVEHGHQRAEEINAYEDFFDPRSSDAPTQLYYPPGSRFVVNILNELEREHWFVDHVKPITALIWFALQWNFDLASKLLVEFIRHTDSEENALLADLENDDERSRIARQYADDADFRLQFHQQIQPYLNVMPIDSLTPGDNPLEMGRADQQQQQTMLQRVAEAIAEREKAKAVLFGHTHYPLQKSLGNGSVYINTGSWIEDFSDASPELWQALFDGSRQPDKKSASLPYARIDYTDENAPTAQLLYVGETVGQAEAKGFINWLARIFKSD
jgi:UDP-2,3-diacylglucosamine pyrophosphatase LpxH